MDEKETERLVRFINVVSENIQSLQERVKCLERQYNASASEQMLPANIKNEIVMISNQLSTQLKEQSEGFKQKTIDIQAEIAELYTRIDLLAETCSESVRKSSQRIESLENQNAVLQKRIEMLEKCLKNNSAGTVPQATIPPIPKVSNAHDFSYDKDYYDNNKLAITGYTSFEEKPVLVIPPKIENMSVYEIGRDAFKNCEFLRVMQLPEGLKEIGGDAFQGCSNLRKIYIPASVNKINSSYDPFEYCSSKLVIYCQPGSYAVKWARDHGYKVKPAQEFSLD